MMDSGIIPKAQLLHVLINKVFKGFFQDHFESWCLTAPLNHKTGSPYAPSWQLLCLWVLKTWEKVPEELIAKVWIVCGYCLMENFDQIQCNSIVEFEQHELESIV